MWLKRHVAAFCWAASAKIELRSEAVEVGRREPPPAGRADEDHVRVTNLWMLSVSTSEGGCVFRSLLVRERCVQYEVRTETECV